LQGSTRVLRLDQKGNDYGLAYSSCTSSIVVVG
jgi:hypothetical protein